MLELLKKVRLFSSGRRFEFYAAAGACAGALYATADDRITTLAAAAVTAAAAILFAERRRSAVFILAMAAVLISGYWNRRISEGHYAAFSGERTRRVTAQVRLIDTSLSASSSLATPKFLAAEVLALRDGDGNLVPAHGFIFVCRTFRTPEEKDTYRYGEVLETSGALVPSGQIRAARVEGQRRTFSSGAGLQDFDDYLASRGSAGVLYMDSVLALERRPGVMGRILHVRDLLIDAVNSEISEPRTRRLVAAMFFGCKQGLEKSDRREFVDSGTVHIFAVSGMHVAVLAGLLLLLLRGVPFRLRYYLLALILGIYVLTTGANAPAVRAFLMIGSWCVLRSTLRFIPTFAILQLTAAALLIYNPYYIADVGFLFSFMVTGALLLFADRQKDFNAVSGDMRLYQAIPQRRKRAGDILKKLAAAAAACGVAFLAGSAVALSAFGLFIPGSILANFLMLPLIALLFQTVIVKLMLFWVPGLNWLLAKLIGLIFDAVSAVIDLCGATFGGGTLTQLPFWTAAAFTLGFFLLLAVRGRNARYGAALLLAASVAAVFFFQRPRPAEILLLSGGSGDAAALVMVDPGAGFAVAVNTPPRDAAAAVAAFLSEHGIAKLDLLIFSDAGAAASRSLEALAWSVRIERVAALAPGGTLAKKIPEAPLPEDCAIVVSQSVYRDSLLEIKAEKGSWRFAYQNPATNSKLHLRIEETPSGRRISGDAGSGELAMELETSNVTEIRRFGKHR